MRLDRALLFLNLLLILVSVTAHQIGAEEFSFLIVTVVVCAAVWRRTSIGRPFRLNDLMATLTCLVAFIALMYRGLSPALSGGFRMFDVGVAPVGDFLIVFQWAYLCREKKNRDYFWVYLVTLVHMGTAGLLMPGVGYAVFFLVYAVVAVCALSVQHLVLEAAGAGTPAKETRAGAGYFLRYLPVTVLLMVPVAALFLLLPRRSGESAVGRHLVGLETQPVAGFSPTLRLGEMGEIQDNPQRVMHVTVRDPVTEEPIQAAPILLRGVTLETYSHKDTGWCWERTKLPRAKPLQYAEDGADLDRIYRGSWTYSASFPGFFTAPYRKLVCDITLEPLDAPFLFVPFAPEIVTSQRWLRFDANTQSHVLHLVGARRRAQTTYRVISRVFDPQPPRGAPAGRHCRRARWLRTWTCRRGSRPGSRSSPGRSLRLPFP